MSRPFTKSEPMTRDELLKLADTITVDLRTAARALGISISNAYALTRAEKFPVTVLHIGSQYKVLTAELFEFLGMEIGNG